MEWKIPLFKTYSDEADVEAVTKIIRRGTYWADGPEIKEFEEKVSKFIGTKYALAFNSGTSALHILLDCLDIKDKEVIVPSFTFVATANAVLLAGGIPVFAEAEGETYGLDADDVEKKITKNTKAIMTIHYGGFPARDTLKLKKLAKDKGILFLEDAAQSFSSSIDGKRVGGLGDGAIFSLVQNKVLAAGEGGILLTNNQEVYEKAKLLRSHGRVEESEDYFSNIKDNDYITVGYNFRLSTMLAALGMSQLEKVDKIANLRRTKAHKYSEAFKDIPEIIIPKELDGHYPVYQMYTIRLPNKKTRDSLQKHLSDKGIMSKVYFYPIHLKTLYMKKYGYKKGDLPITEKLSDTVLNIPLFPRITEEEITYLIESVKEYFKGDTNGKH